MKLLTMLGAGVLAAGTLVGIAEPASAQHYRHGYSRAYGNYGHGLRHYGYRHGYYGGRHYGWRNHYRWHQPRGYYRHHRYYR